jgi:hypothetical protein
MKAKWELRTALSLPGPQAQRFRAWIASVSPHLAKNITPLLNNVARVRLPQPRLVYRFVCRQSSCISMLPAVSSFTLS